MPRALRRLASLPRGPSWLPLQAQAPAPSAASSPEQLTSTDADRLRSLTDSLLTHRLDGPPVFAGWVDEFRETLGLGKGLIYGLRREAAGFAVSFGYSAAMPVGHSAFVNGFEDMMRTAPGRWDLFDPELPEPAQRNHACPLPPVSTFGAQVSTSAEHGIRYGLQTPEAAALALLGYRHAARFFEQVELHKDWQLRVLICDGPSLLGWVGGMCADEPTPRQVRMLQSLVPALTQRLRFDQQLSCHRLAAAVIVEALEELPRAAFLVTKQGSVELANSAGREKLEQQPTSVRRELSDALEGRAAEGFVVRTVRSEGLPDHLLIMGPCRSPRADRLAATAKALALSPRQRQVLDCVLKGQSNKVIASGLRCSERTIEVHLTNVFRKASVQSRSELMAYFWREG